MKHIVVVETLLNVAPCFQATQDIIDTFLRVHAHHVSMENMLRMKTRQLERLLKLQDYQHARFIVNDVSVSPLAPFLSSSCSSSHIQNWVRKFHRLEFLLLFRENKHQAMIQSLLKNKSFPRDHFNSDAWIWCTLFAELSFKRSEHVMVQCYRVFLVISQHVSKSSFIWSNRSVQRFIQAWNRVARPDIAVNALQNHLVPVDKINHRMILTLYGYLATMIKSEVIEFGSDRCYDLKQLVAFLDHVCQERILEPDPMMHVKLCTARASVHWQLNHDVSLLLEAINIASMMSRSILDQQRKKLYPFVGLLSYISAQLPRSEADTLTSSAATLLHGHDERIQAIIHLSKCHGWYKSNRLMTATAEFTSYTWPLYFTASVQRFFYKLTLAVCTEGNLKRGVDATPAVIWRILKTMLIDFFKNHAQLLQSDSSDLVHIAKALLGCTDQENVLFDWNEDQLDCAKSERRKLLSALLNEARSFSKTSHVKMKNMVSMVLQTNIKNIDVVFITEIAAVLGNARLDFELILSVIKQLLSQSSLKPDVILLNTILNSLAITGNVQQTWDVFDQLRREFAYDGDIVSLSILAKTYTRSLEQNDDDETLQLIWRMAERFYSPGMFSDAVMSRQEIKEKSNLINLAQTICRGFRSTKALEAMRIDMDRIGLSSWRDVRRVYDEQKRRLLAKECKTLVT